MDVELHVPLASHLAYQRFEYLLEERVLQLVILHVAVYGYLGFHVFQQLDVPVDELGVQSAVQPGIDDINLVLQLPHEDAAFGAAVLAFVFSGAGSP